MPPGSFSSQRYHSLFIFQWQGSLHRQELFYNISFLSMVKRNVFSASGGQYLFPPRLRSEWEWGWADPNRYESFYIRFSYKSINIIILFPTGSWLFELNERFQSESLLWGKVGFFFGLPKVFRDEKQGSERSGMCVGPLTWPLRMGHYSAHPAGRPAGVFWDHGPVLAAGGLWWLRLHSVTVKRIWKVSDCWPVSCSGTLLLDSVRIPLGLYLKDLAQPTHVTPFTPFMPLGPQHTCECMCPVPTRWAFGVHKWQRVKTLTNVEETEGVEVRWERK